MIDAPLFFVPGFMGNTKDFQSLTTMSGINAPLVEWHWPYASGPMTFTEYASLAWESFSLNLPDEFFIYGYSMGGRILLAWLQREDFRARCQGAFVASAHPGLTDALAREQRRKHDRHWASLFRILPLRDVLTAWYQQGVFDSLSPDEKQKQIDAKLHGLGGDYANLLETVSLSQQPDLRSSLTIFENCRYLVGQQDSKFLALASTFGSNSKLEIIENAGHLLHVEQPTALANMIQRQRQLWR